jgi:hypothetical protein
MMLEAVLSINAKDRLPVGGAGPWPRCRSDHERFDDLLRRQTVIASPVAYLMFKQRLLLGLGARVIVVASDSLSLDRIGNDAREDYEECALLTDQVKEALDACAGEEQVMLIGCYERFVDWISVYHVTRVNGNAIEDASCPVFRQPGGGHSILRTVESRTNICSFERWEVTKEVDATAFKGKEKEDGYIPPSKRKEPLFSDEDLRILKHLQTSNKWDALNDQEDTLERARQSKRPKVTPAVERDDPGVIEVIRMMDDEAEYEKAMIQFAIQDGAEEQ